MSSWLWESVLHNGLAVPRDHSLPRLTGELGQMLGDPDPDVRDRIAITVLSTWVSTGVYDHLLGRLGSGLVEYLSEGLGSYGDDSVFKRSASARVLAEVIERDNRMTLLPAHDVRQWGDAIVHWWLAEKDLRGFVPQRGWSRPVAAGAQCAAALARSPHVRRRGLALLLDAVAERLLTPTPEIFAAGEPDALAEASVEILRRDLVDSATIELWLRRLGGRAVPVDDDPLHPMRVNGNVQSFLRALHLQLALGADRFESRADTLLALVEQLIASNPALRAHGAHVLVDGSLPEASPRPS